MSFPFRLQVVGHNKIYRRGRAHREKEEVQCIELEGNAKSRPSLESDNTFSNNAKGQFFKTGL